MGEWQRLQKARNSEPKDSGNKKSGKHQTIKKKHEYYLHINPPRTAKNKKDLELRIKINQKPSCINLLSDSRGN